MNKALNCALQYKIKIKIGVIQLPYKFSFCPTLLFIIPSRCVSTYTSCNISILRSVLFILFTVSYNTAVKPSHIGISKTLCGISNYVYLNISFGALVGSHVDNIYASLMKCKSPSNFKCPQLLDTDNGPLKLVHIYMMGDNAFPDWYSVNCAAGQCC
jgi:hypothetical protein